MGSRWDRIGVVSIALAVLGAAILGLVYQYRSNMAEDNARRDLASRRAAIIAVCESRGMEAMDIEYPHSPKCWDAKSELMRIPRELYKVRGGRL